MLSSLALLNSANASTSVGGTISSDTTWTKAESPYSLTGSIRINSGVTLTVEPGVTVNFNTYFIQVDGYLVAKGTESDKILFMANQTKPNAQLYFTESSSSWNEQTGLGSIIKNVALKGATIDIKNASPKISTTTLRGMVGKQIRCSKRNHSSIGNESRTASR